jgi:hypothetical protein
MRGQEPFFNGKLVVSLVFVIICFTSCNNSNPTNNNSSTSEHHLVSSNNGQTVLMEIGDTIDITLQAIGPGSYELPEIEGNAINFIYDSTISPFIPAGPTQKYGFVGINIGSSSISISDSNMKSVFAITCRVQ